MEKYVTPGGIEVTRTATPLDSPDAVEAVVDALDERAGVVLSSSYEYPGRYSRWTIGFVDPPLRFVSRGRELRVAALNDRGRLLLPAVLSQIEGLDAVGAVSMDGDEARVEVRPADRYFPEELRSRQHTVFSVLRGIIDCFAHEDEPHLGLYGAFGYDLAFQFDPIDLRIPRPEDQRDLVLYLPDDIVVVDGTAKLVHRYQYEFAVDGRCTAGMPRATAAAPFAPRDSVDRERDHAPGEYGDLVRVAHESFRRGDLFEVVPGQSFYVPCSSAPSEIFRRLRRRNPAPYGAFLNLGEGEYLVGASPEMFVRAEGRRIETCPISGTIARGEDAISDAEQILKLLSSEKDASELTMCTDVDRNDKARVCEPDSIRVIGRRQLELYSRVIHTVDHVEGTLRAGFDPLDAFLSHTWAVTVTGAPKLWAMRFIEEHERSPRAWYGGALGVLGFNRGMNTGLTLRTMRIKDGVAEVRAGGTLLIDSDPAAEERETEMKAAALLDAILRPDPPADDAPARPAATGQGKRVLLLDCQDSFVHTLASYIRREGAEVMTVRAGMPPEALHALLEDFRPDLLFLSPGPGRPEDFEVSSAVGVAIERNLPLFGVCLGLQGIVEHFGGELGILPNPMHGRSSNVRVLGGTLFSGLPSTFEAGRYHSLFARREAMPPELVVTAESEDGVIMAIEHTSLPIAAVQFHPESIMTLKQNMGARLVANLLEGFAR